jgi:plastocyanin
MRSWMWVIVILVIAVVAVFVYFFGIRGNNSEVSQTEVPAANTVEMKNIAFNPNKLTVPVGTKVTFTNQDSVTHTVTSDTGLFDSGNISHGNQFEFTFKEKGTYNYHCSIHPGMTGTIVVE